MSFDPNRVLAEWEQANPRPIMTPWQYFQNLIGWLTDPGQIRDDALRILRYDLGFDQQLLISAEPGNPIRAESAYIYGSFSAASGSGRSAKIRAAYGLVPLRKCRYFMETDTWHMPIHYRNGTIHWMSLHPGQVPSTDLYQMKPAEWYTWNFQVDALTYTVPPNGLVPPQQQQQQQQPTQQPTRRSLSEWERDKIDRIREQS